MKIHHVFGIPLVHRIATNRFHPERLEPRRIHRKRVLDDPPRDSPRRHRSIDPHLRPTSRLRRVRPRVFHSRAHHHAPFRVFRPRARFRRRARGDRRRAPVRVARAAVHDVRPRERARALDERSRHASCELTVDLRENNRHSRPERVVFILVRLRRSRPRRRDPATVSECPLESNPSIAARAHVQRRRRASVDPVRLERVVDAIGPSVRSRHRRARRRRRARAAIVVVARGRLDDERPMKSARWFARVRRRREDEEGERAGEDGAEKFRVVVAVVGGHRRSARGEGTRARE